MDKPSPEKIARTTTELLAGKRVLAATVKGKELTLLMEDDIAFTVYGTTEFLPAPVPVLAIEWASTVQSSLTRNKIGQI